MTLQKLIRQQDLQDEEGLAAIINKSDPAVWRDRMNSLAMRGWLEKDLNHWIWILTERDPDRRIERFVAEDSPKPLFLLMLLVASSQTIKTPKALVSVVDYISKYYHTPNPGSSVKLGWNDPKMALSMEKFMILLRRLVRHAQRIWPKSMVTLAQLTIQYIESLPSAYKKHGGDSIYWKQCLVFNAALSLFSRPTPMNPIQNMDLNWRAQRLLLSMSDGMKRPLIIDRMSYRGIRRVMVGLKKNTSESKVTERYSTSWPPYRQDFDGLDAKRTLDDDLSRSAKVGVLQREAGYDGHDYDEALGALGGMTSGSPTIQTRSLTPKEGKYDEDFHSLWAMKVRSTRNAQEAWRVFIKFSDAEPSIRVYGEMFMKLLAREVDNPGTTFPGDSREVFPTHDGNLTEYELSRLSPPTVDELYNHMISSGIKPQGTCLRQLVSNARSVEEGLRYLRDAGFTPSQISQITLEQASSYPALGRIPLLLFSSIVQLLCRLQPNRRGNRGLSDEELYPIYRAIKLTKTRLSPVTPEGSTFRPPWLHICRALARPYVAVINADQLDNDVEALAMFLDILTHTDTTIGVDLEIFIYLCRTMQKVVLSFLDVYDTSSKGKPQYSVLQLMQSKKTRFGLVLHAANQYLETTFSKMVAPAPQSQQGNLAGPDTVHEVSSVHLHAYMRTLALLNDIPTMVDLLEWMFRNKSYVDEQAERIGSRAYAMIAKTLCAFEAFAGPRLDPDKRDMLDELMMHASQGNQPWRWPTAEDLEEYIASDKRGGSQKLRRRAVATWWEQPADGAELGQATAV